MSDDRLRDVFDHHWQQFRHIEKLRYSYTNIYVVIVAGLLAVTVRDGGPQDEYTAGFLAFLSFVGIIVNVKLGLEYYHRMKYVLALADRLDVGQEMGRPLGMYGDEQRTGFAVARQPRRWVDFVRNPPSAKTSELVSPGHWVLLLHIGGFGVSVSWFLVVLFDIGFAATFLGVEITAGTVITAAVSAAAVVIVYVYTHAKFERIDDLVEWRVE